MTLNVKNAVVLLIIVMYVDTDLIENLSLIAPVKMDTIIMKSIFVFLVNIRVLFVMMLILVLYVFQILILIDMI